MANSGCANSTCTNTTCKTCQPTCYSAQTLCKTSQNASSYGTHTWPASFSKDQIIYNVLPRSVFNTALTYISSALGAGSSKNTATWSETAETRDFIYADKVNAMLGGLRKFANASELDIPNDVTGGVNGDVITAAFFSKIASALNNAQIAADACNACNAGCNVTCKNCQGCVGCEGCNTCQGYTTCHSPCHSPCHTPCNTPEN